LLWLGTTFASPLAWLAPVALAAGAAFALRSVARTARGSRALDRARLAVPLIGRLLRAAVHARLARTLGTLVCAGVDLTRALEVAAPVTGSPVVAEALAGVALAIRAGEGLAPPLEAAGCFDPLFVSLVAVGEETGMLDELLERAAAYFETDVEAAVAALSAIVEPVLVVVLGAVVGLIVSSVYLPLYQLIGSLGQ